MDETCNQVITWPCTFQGSEEFFGIDLKDFLESEGDQFKSISWELPNGLVSLVEAVQNDIAYIKLRAVYPGQHIVKFSLESIEGTDTQIHLGKALLTVERYE